MTVIGICGGSGSGKTTLLNRLATQYKNCNPSIFSMDNYYRPYKEQLRDKNGVVNFDLPTALDEEKLVADLKKIISGQTIEVIEYQFNAKDEEVLLTIEPSELLIVEGLFVFAYERVRKALDFSIFVEVRPDIQLDRRIYRDQDNRGYSREAIIYQWENHVIPCYNNYLVPYIEQADFIFRNDSHAEEDFINLTSTLNKEFIK